VPLFSTYLRPTLFFFLSYESICLQVQLLKQISPQIMDGTVISEMRTAAASAVATKVRDLKKKCFSVFAGCQFQELKPE